MSGFCGWFTRDPLEDPKGTLECMARALPSYGEFRAESCVGASFGLALRSHASMGSIAQEGGIVAAIEGYPVWSEVSLRDLAVAHGQARALIAAFKRKGSGLLDVLRGTFSLALIDSTEQRVLCAIDRLGIQTLCYADVSPTLLVFGSTTDAVRAHPSIGSTIELQSIFDYLCFTDRIPAPATIYREQRKLIPGSCLVRSEDRTTVKTYWQMPYRTEARSDAKIVAEELKRRLRDAVAASLAGEDERQVGAFLSGGLDSSSVAGIAAGLVAAPLQTFTIGFPVEGFDEAYYADIAAKRFRTKHSTYYLHAPDVLDVILKSAQIYDEPFANSSVVPTYHCARIAKEAGIEMMLAGDGGDELFAGNKRYAEDRIFDHYARLPPILRRGVLERYAGAFSLAGKFGRKIQRYIEKANRSVPERLADNMFGAIEPGEVLAAELLRAVDTDLPLARASEIFNAPGDADKVQRMMHLDLRITLADGDLRKVVRMCELAGVRVRFPFLNDDVVEFSAGLPESLLMENGELRKFYKDAMRDFLPAEIINKKKHGFGLPYMAFMNAHPPLRELICDSLTGLKRRGYFRDDFVDGLVDRARQGALSHNDSVAWDLLVLELWLVSREKAPSRNDSSA